MRVRRPPRSTEGEALTSAPLRELGRVRYPDNDQVTRYLTRPDPTGINLTPGHSQLDSRVYLARSSPVTAPAISHLKLQAPAFAPSGPAPSSPSHSLHRFVLRPPSSALRPPPSILYCFVTGGRNLRSLSACALRLLHCELARAIGLRSLA